MAYALIMGTRPQTLYGLADSPVDLAAFALDHGDGTGQPGLVKQVLEGRLQSDLTRDDLLDNITLYWLTNTSATAVRYHYAEAHAGGDLGETGPRVSHGRLGVAVFADDFKTMRPLAERDNTGIVHWSEFPRGGHYAALEVPDDVVADLRVFFGSANA